MFTAALFTTAKTWKPPNCPSTDKWIKKLWYIYVYNEILSSQKKGGNPAIFNNMDLEGIMLSGMSDRQILFYLIYLWTQKMNNKLNS